MIKKAAVNRDPYWDALKFTVIIFVVVLHVTGPYCYGNVFDLAFHNLIYLFINPLFVFISGRFSVIHDKKKYKKGILRLLETFVVFQLIWMVLLTVAKGEFPLIEWFKPYWAMWYLLSLTFWRLTMLFWGRLINDKPLSFFATSVCVSLAAGFIPLDNLFAFQKTFSFYPFFIAGYISRNCDLKYLLKKIPTWLAISIMFLFFVLSYMYAERTGRKIAWEVALSYDTYRICHLVMRSVYYLSSICVCIAVMCLFNKMRNKERLSVLGGSTIYIYISYIYRLCRFSVNR